VLAVYDAYQDKASACDAWIEAVPKQLSFRPARVVGPLPSPRRGMRRQPSGPEFDVRAALFALLGKDLTQINGLDRKCGVVLRARLFLQGISRRGITASKVCVVQAPAGTALCSSPPRLKSDAFAYFYRSVHSPQ
jgi:hypothetical protein